MTQELSPEKIAQNLKKPTGEAGIRIGDFMHKGNINFYVQLQRFFNWQPNMNVLEVGMGNGKHIAQLFELFPQGIYYGIDYSKTMVSESQKNNQDLVNQNKVSIQEDEASTFKLHLDFDLIFTINTVYFFDDLEPLFENLKQHLKPNGTLVIGKRPKSDMERLNDITQFGFNRYSNNEVKRAMENVGLNIVDEHSFKDPEIEMEGETFNLNSDFILAKK